MNIRVFYSLGRENYGCLANLEEAAKMSKTFYGDKRIVGGPHSLPLRTALLRNNYGTANSSGKSITISVGELVEFARMIGGGSMIGTNMHNHVTAEDALRAIATPPPWIKQTRPDSDWRPALIAEDLVD